MQKNIYMHQYITFHKHPPEKKRRVKSLQSFSYFKTKQNETKRNNTVVAKTASVNTVDISKQPWGRAGWGDPADRAMPEVLPPLAPL